ncbi:phosphatase PAP2 family protein [Legionella sp. CNM-4043-24]|uniref:phosphatase PAP2 family protein n=1 Tax=Legionella sp. CNM-4043-24 TaxID=3421646 RepID=UPI00403A998C
MPHFKRLLSFMIKPWMIVLYLFLVVFSFFYIDRPLAEYLISFDLRNNFYLLNLFTKLGSFAPWLVLFFGAGIYCRYVRPNRLWEERSWFLLLCVFVTSAVCGILKTMLGRARPEAWFSEQAWGFYGFHAQNSYWSLPSGHTTTIMTLAFALSVVFPRYFGRFIAIGLLVSLSRVLLVHHYLSDVLSAAFLALIEVGLLVWLLQKKSWLPLVVDRKD